MKTYQKIIVGICSITLLACLFINIKQAYADAAPPPAPVGSDFFPSIENTNVRMVSEYVLIDIAGDTITSYDNHLIEHANVTAFFTMQNLGDTTEQMRVRFPMNHSDYDLDYEIVNKKEFCEYSPYPSLNEINIWVNGNKVNTEITYQTTEDYMASPNEKGEAVYKTVPCWAYFDVTFPPSQEVNIKVAYTVSGYDFNDIGSGEVEFLYVLQTGAGWKDTIGKAEIVARLPYDANELNVARCFPENCTMSGKEIVWHFEDFEPEENIKLWIVRPTIWQRVLTERENIRNHPNDGESWGRLGKAYKEALRDGKGMIFTHPERRKELFTLSSEAYSKAVELLPNDADWQYGFADLLCNGAMWGESTVESWRECVKRLKNCLDLNPLHEQGNELLDFIANVKNPNIVDLNGPEPNFLILTPGNNPTSTPTQKATQTLLPSPTRTKVIQTSTPTQEQLPTDEKTSTATELPKSISTPEISSTELPVQNSNDMQTTPDNKIPVLGIVIGGVLMLIVTIIVYSYSKNN